MSQTSHKEHLSVLPKEVLDCLKPQAGESYLDLTAGYGGHAELVLDKTKAPGNSLLVDRDAEAIAVLKRKFSTATVIHQDFLGACRELAEKGKHFDMILADLGVSSPHFDRAERGFAFTVDGPLDMRMDQRQGLTAEQLVNGYSEKKLDEIIAEFGEEKAHKRVARAIVEARPIHTTKQLASVVESVAGRKFRAKKIHPATKTFQALRIAVNDELGQLEQSLDLMCEMLAPGGRLAIISFHSLEDRIVKRYFSEHAGDRYDTELTHITRRPIVPGLAEINSNPRARSAKLRAVVKIKKER